MSYNMKVVLLWVMVIPVYFIFRISIANKMPIMDCDEVYNYWEPLHFILYGSGLQTWEYSHQFALRTYAYLMPLSYIASYIIQPLIDMYPRTLFILSQDLLSIDSTMPASTEKVLLFMLLRCTVAVSTAISELFFILTLANLSNRHFDNTAFVHLTPITTSTVFWTTILMLSSSGMNHSAGAFLPSTTWMSAWCICTSFFLRQRYLLFGATAIITTLATGWPFGCVCVVPMAFHILYKKYLSQNESIRFYSLLVYLVQLVAITAFVQFIVMKVDEFYYGKRNVSPTLNIFKYNAAGGGDELYGVEPLSYYIKNLLLNFNIVAILGMITLPIISIRLFMYGATPAVAANIGQANKSLTTDVNQEVSTTDQYTTSRSVIVDYDVISVLLSLPIWMLVTFPRPHKEERFLFPIYPVLSFGAVISLHTIVEYLSQERPRQHIKSECSSVVTKKRFVVLRWIWKFLLIHPQILPILIYSCSIFISFCRTLALYHYYSAPLVAYNELALQPLPTASERYEHFSYSAHDFKLKTSSSFVCTCGEWYRYPSSFYLPVGTQLGFLPSSFRGQLPQPFTKYGSKPESLPLQQQFNDRNEHVDERYLPVYRAEYECLWFVVLHGEDEDSMCGWPRLYGKSRVSIVPFLDVAKTKSSLHRVLYIPGYHDDIYSSRSTTVTYDDYVVYQEVAASKTLAVKPINWNPFSKTVKRNRYGLDEF